ncbi:helix-turn-helix domain-containing protein [uncultured Oscillibacter sp.]|uniref:response regulator transcription factor n=1 Tax=uncultured Oscillibacter sp. TaxID=876091 RepID=UPI00262237B9|nr:helix-turn-helix domain-containing protein [uncultured Oscillibacter sp.]
MEDEPKSRQALASRLRSILGESALIELASDGGEAVSKAALVQPDLIFMDIEMPLKSGVEAAAVIKRHRPETHVVFLTAYDRFDYAVGALRSGGEEYLLKPVQEVELRETLEKFFDVAPQAAHQVSPFEAELEVWVRQHYTEDAPLEDAAASLGMSPFYFSRQVKAATGKTFLEYITTYRIERAKQRLASTELSVSEVGRAVGYPDSNYFTKVFKRFVGCTPTAYRASQS